jgi:CBS domain containing-hemolysin-like protein
LEEALQEMTHAGAHVARVVDAHERPVGRLTMDAVVSAMVTPVESNSTKAAAMEGAEAG